MNGVLPVLFVPVRFSGRKRDVLADKLKQYETGWRDLIAWDRKKHAAPVLKEVRLDRLLLNARAFLERQQVATAGETVPFIVGISGSPASGKTTVQTEWRRAFPPIARKMLGWRKRKHAALVDTLELDDYTKDTSKRRKRLDLQTYFKTTNFDTPKHVSLDLLRQQLMLLRNGKAVRAPQYDFGDASRLLEQRVVVPAPFVLLEGFLAFVPEPLRKLMDLKLFFMVDAQTMHDRWWKRAPERQVVGDSAQMMYQRALTGYRKYTQPTAAHADVVVNSAAPLAQINETMRALTRLLLQTFYPTRHR